MSVLFNRLCFVMFRLLTLFALIQTAPTPSWAITIDSKLEVDPPPELLVRNSGGEMELDSSISPKLVKAFYEIHFVPASELGSSGNGIVSVTAAQKCPFVINSALCKYYFTPSRIVTVQKIDDFIEKNKGDETVPVVQGIVASKVETDNIMKELNKTINDKVNAIVPLNKNKTNEIPVYQGVVNTQEVLKRPEYNASPYRPYYPPPARPPYPWNTVNNGWSDCLHPPCPWRTPYSSGILNTHLR